MKSARVCQMIGYTVPTWYGYAGWGMLDYFVEQPGRFTLAEAFIANQAALDHRLATCFPGEAGAKRKTEAAASRRASPAAQAAGLSANDARGLAHDRDKLAFYGDPAWEARMAPAQAAWEQKLTVADGRYQLDVRPLRGEKSFEAVNTNGSQRGGRPIVQFLPERIDPKSVHVEEGADLKPEIRGRFLLVPLPEKCDPARTYRVVFRAKDREG
jgi:zinc protease